MTQENPTNKELEAKIDAYFVYLLKINGIPPEKAGAAVYDVNAFVYNLNKEKKQ